MLFKNLLILNQTIIIVIITISWMNDGQQKQKNIQNYRTKKKNNSEHCKNKNKLKKKRNWVLKPMNEEKNDTK